MTADEFNRFCAALAHTGHVVQWGGAEVWKVAGKVFAIGGWSESANLGVSFKCTAVAFEILKEQPGLRPAPYLASRGMSWIQRTGAQSMSDATLKGYIRESHHIVSLGLPKKLQRELGLNQDVATAITRRLQKSKPSAHSPRGRA